MARVCILCGKRPNSAFRVSHSNRHTKRRQLPNLSKRSVVTSKGVKRGYVCNKCLKANKTLLSA